MVRSNERNYLRAWREFRGLTQAKLAEMVGTTGAVISLLESGDRGLSDKWLRKLAPVLGCGLGDLLMYDPHDVDTDILETWKKIPEARRGQAAAVLRTFVDPDFGEAAPPDSPPPPTPGGAASPGSGGPPINLKKARAEAAKTARGATGRTSNSSKT